jgi:hypothetical protein
MNAIDQTLSHSAQYKGAAVLWTKVMIGIEAFSLAGALALCRKKLTTIVFSSPLSDESF